MGTDNLFQKVGESFVNGTNDREAYPKRWIAVLVQMNCEKKASTLLNKSGYETYIPIQQEIIKKYFDAKDGANNYYAKADECKTNALINFEKEIF